MFCFSVYTYELYNMNLDLSSTSTVLHSKYHSQWKKISYVARSEVRLQMHFQQWVGTLYKVLPKYS